MNFDKLRFWLLNSVLEFNFIFFYLLKYVNLVLQILWINYTTLFIILLLEIK